MFLRRIPNIYHRVVKKSVFSLVLHTPENDDTFTTQKDIYIFFLFFFYQKKSKFSLYFILKGELHTFFSGCFSSDCTFSVCLLGIILGVNLVCLRTAFLRNQPLEKV